MFTPFIKILPSVKALTLFLCLLVISCGGSDNSTQTNDAQQTSILPSKLNNTQLILTLNSNNSTIIKEDLPEINKQLNHYFGNGDVLYLHTEKSTDWQHRGTFNYKTKDNNNAEITINLASSREYKLICQFISNNAGTCNAELEQGIEIEGDFTLLENPQVKDHQFSGTLIEELRFNSSITGITYPYHIYLPPNYEQSTKSFPVIYATDGQWEFHRFAHAIETSNKEIILIAIEQGPNERRIQDYALTGSDSYIRFLSDELLPEVEANYRIDISNRALQGASWGGLLVRHALSRELNHPLFNHFISMDGSYFHDDEKYSELEDIAFPSGSNLAVTLYLSGASIAGNNNVVLRFKDDIKDREIAELSLYHQTFNVSHEQVSRPSIKDALLKLYPE